MKKLILLGLAIVLSLNACKQQEKRYTQQSPEIDTYKKIIDAYNKQDWEAMTSHYADSAKIMNNVLEKDAITLAELVAVNKKDASFFTSWEYVDGQSDYEMVVTDKGKTYVNFWGTWKGTVAANNKTYTIPTHITAQFKDGKVIKEFGYWDLSKIMLDMQAMEQAAAAAVNDSIN
ncbi:nuclear transport factor 2 family protein [Aequorivita sp. F47161]|uniref:Nuclear transport factor 2 family protein n=1 Tax=Aequorivita vitellina TaxID=2874475 RepID=A0A9X1U3I9_9FLAO|nr:nuclear transport factor 2 family protein [Aequorivita vitellina]MCG2419312.1 nuclear transport factor 2 family protein [Aequorivita vitellina]